MTIKKPYRRNCRQFIDGSYSHSGQSRYILDRNYAKDPEQYVRAFLLVQKDLKELFDYIDPSYINLDCHSFRIHQLLMRVCIEVEANCKAILLENGYIQKINKQGKKINLTMNDYRKLEETHLLSEYQVKIPYWRGEGSVRTPFISWSSIEKNPDWYVAYHETKHNRHEGFEEANFGNLIDAVCGLLVLLSAQFYTCDFSTGAVLMSADDSNKDDMEPAIGDYFRIKFPIWPEDKRYSFTYKDYQDNKNNPNFFQLLDYNNHTIRSE